MLLQMLLYSFLFHSLKLLNKLCNLWIREKITTTQKSKCCSRKHSYKLAEPRRGFKHRDTNSKFSSELKVQIYLVVNT